jgi:hypothetical protein
MLISLPDTVKGRDIKMLEKRALMVNRQADSYDASPHEILQIPCTALLPSYGDSRTIVTTAAQ